MISEYLQYEFMQRALFVSVCMGILCPIIGIFLVLRRTSMTGDALAHASLAGVAVGLASSLNPIASSFVFTSAAALLIEALRHFFKGYSDLILTIVLALSVGIAVTLITGGSVRANAESFLFGSILTVTTDDVVVIAFLTLVSLVLLWLFYDRLLCIAFDEEAARVAGVPIKMVTILFALLAAAAVACAIRVAGVLVMSSMLTVPVATALQLKKGFKKTLLAAIVISLFDVITGLLLSCVIDAAPGGVIALVSVTVLFTVLLFRFVFYHVRKI